MADRTAHRGSGEFHFCSTSQFFRLPVSIYPSYFQLPQTADVSGVVEGTTKNLHQSELVVKLHEPMMNNRTRRQPSRIRSRNSSTVYDVVGELVKRRVSPSSQYFMVEASGNIDVASLLGIIAALTRELESKNVYIESNVRKMAGETQTPPSLKLPLADPACSAFRRP